MPTFNTVIVSTLVDVEHRLEAFGFTRHQIMAIGQTARAYADDAGPSMPLNAAGMLSYIHGVGELRQQLVGSDYLPDRACGVESVMRRDRSVRIAFQNVDKSCADMPPLPRSEKGSGAAALSSPTLFEHAGVEPGPLTGVHDGVRTYYVMVGLDGSVELSCPVIEKGKYVDWIERIYIYSPDGDWEAAPDTDTGPVEDFEVHVSFKD
ncbi:hypothetical protein [Cognatiyoonia sp. IB215182]|uniref:hypothetical protein n=1 Tax=Cognatiyoonia sp. IB215182 TaxID=3097353 RepID=UPI002A1504A3|nr:hypothetical protein [Cognatiyoonia sp. IB215182]MDX8353989.1 hypothetical protein [Cognatiyoonia sp. IB215182]